MPKCSFTSESFHVNSLRSPFFFRGVDTSIIFPLNEDDKTFLARPSLILCAIPMDYTFFERTF